MVKTTEDIDVALEKRAADENLRFSDVVEIADTVNLDSTLIFLDESR